MNQQKEFNSVWENIYFQLELAHKNKIESAKNRFRATDILYLVCCSIMLT